MLGVRPRFVPLYWFAIVALGLLILFKVPALEAQLAAEPAGGGKVIAVDVSNRTMAEAIDRARETLPLFFKALAGPFGDKENFALKVAIKDGTRVEHKWLVNLKNEGGQWSGVVHNQPFAVTTVKRGQRFMIAHNNISDWMYLQDQKIYGGYTVRVLAEMLAPQDANVLKAALANVPE